MTKALDKNSGASAVNLAVNVGGLSMKNPVTVASGTFASGREYAELWQASVGASSEPSKNVNPATELEALGALTTKGVSFEPWTGNATPRIAETPSGMLNAIGLQNKGVEAFCQDDLTWLAKNAPELPLVVNVCGHTVDEFAPVIERLEQETVVDAYEINISCPNLDCGGMALGVDPEVAAAVTRTCRAATKRPLIVKLTPNVTDITEIAKSVEAAGAGALSLINTVAGMAIDAKLRKPLLARGSGGLSGPAIKPVALLAVHRCYQAVSVPLIGMGGIRNATDAIEFMLAGATAVAVGTANFADPLVALRLADEMQLWCESQGVEDINELIGGLLA
ncbi:MAG: dihydroorotate dehydrogenase [Coriobacteriia bacterium]|nr:dihydroorotate dehydrogenase [Coriobacteriia bacterium]